MLALLCVLSAGCRESPPTSRAPAPAAPATSTATAAVPHGDHNPHHGGVVMMKGDLHYEVVADKGGQWQLFFTDAVREDLPASIASRVSFVVHRPGEADEPIELHIDDTGESWTGSGRAVVDPSPLTVGVSFTIDGEPYAIDVPMGNSQGPNSAK